MGSHEHLRAVAGEKSRSVTLGSSLNAQSSLTELPQCVVISDVL